MHARHAHGARVALGLDREHAGGADQDVVDIALAEARVVNHAPILARHLVEQPPHLLLARGAAVVTLDERQHVAQDHEHARQQRDLRAQEAQRSRSPKVRPRNAVATARTPSATSVRMRSRRTVVRSCWPGARAVGS